MNYTAAKYQFTEWLLEWGLHSDAAVELLLMICAHESLGGKHRRQFGGGPALGIFQIEPPTHNSIWDHSDSIRARAKRYDITEDVRKLEFDDKYSVWVVRHYLLMDKNPIPKTPEQMAQYCKSYWNRTGKATPEKYLADWEAWKNGRL